MRLFIALELPQAIKDYVKTLQKKLQNAAVFTGTYPQPETMHVTLAFLGERTEKAIPDIIKHMQTITQRFEVVLDRVNLDNEIHPHVIWIDVISDDLATIAATMNKALNSKEDRPFKGHITVARMKKYPSVPALKKIVDSCTKNPLIFSGTTLTLYASKLTSNGPEHTRLFTQHLL